MLNEFCKTLDCIIICAVVGVIWCRRAFYCQNAIIDFPAKVFWVEKAFSAAVATFIHRRALVSTVNHTKPNSFSRFSDFRLNLVRKSAIYLRLNIHFQFVQIGKIYCQITHILSSFGCVLCEKMVEMVVKSNQIHHQK